MGSHSDQVTNIIDCPFDLILVRVILFYSTLSGAKTKQVDQLNWST